jgi:hypothetical protein
MQTETQYKNGASNKIMTEAFSNVTTVTLANKVSTKTISKMMGHKLLKQTLHYARILH